MAETNVTITNSKLKGGLADNGGAIYVVAGSSLFIQRTQFINNYAERTGGAILCESFD